MSDFAKQKERDLEGMEGFESPVHCLQTAEGKGSERERENEIRICCRREVITNL